MSHRTPGSSDSDVIRLLLWLVVVVFLVVAVVVWWEQGLENLSHSVGVR